MNDKKYVIMNTKSYFCRDDIEQATLMTLDEAEDKLEKEPDPDAFEIWSVRPTITLDEKSTRHVTKRRIVALEAELVQLKSQLSA